MDKYYVSAERLEELKQELQNLKTHARVEVAEQLKRAKEYGDLSENAEYAEAKEEQSRVETRIFELEDLLKRAVIIQKSDVADSVQIGSKVTVKKDGKVMSYTIVGSGESRPEEGKISNESPLGRAFLDRKVGEHVEVATPAGKTTYTISKIE
jgi:transcription elongation factor GreA